MNILVLGNGFDLALGLPTKYTDFLEFIQVIKELHSDEPRTELCINHAYCHSFSGMSQSTYDVIVNKLGWAFHESNRPRIAMQDMYDCVHENAWINHFQKRLSDNQISGENWIDIEREIKIVIQALSAISYDIQPLSEFNGDSCTEIMSAYPINISGILHELRRNNSRVTLSQMSYLKFKNRLRNDFKRFTCALEIYFDFFVRLSKIADGVKLPDILRGKQFNKVLSFNYTDYYNMLQGRKETEDTTCFVHGKLRYCEEACGIDDLIKKSNVIIGFDEYLDDNKKNEQLEFVYYKKYFQRIVRGTGSEYLGWLNECHINSKTGMLLSDTEMTALAVRRPNHVHIFGHSMDPTDKEVFKDLLLREPNDTRVTIYYHDEDAHERIITNLIAIIGQNRLIEKTHRRGSQPADIEIVPQFDNYT